jgi:hypothetical protein
VTTENRFAIVAATAQAASASVTTGYVAAFLIAARPGSPKQPSNTTSNACVAHAFR